MTACAETASAFPALFESKSLALPNRDEEVIFLSEVGRWSCCDLWLYSTNAVWATDVTVKLYGRTGQARVLLKAVQMSSVPSTVAGGIVSALAISLRGHPCTAFEVTCTSTSASAVGAGTVYVHAWSDCSSPEAIGDKLLDGAGDPVVPGSTAHLVGFLDGTGWQRVRVEAPGRLVVVGAGVAGTPAGGVVTVQGSTSGSPVPIVQATPGQLNATVAQGAGGTAAWKVDGSAANQPVTDAGGSLTVDSPQLPAALGNNGALTVEGIAGGKEVPITGTVTQGAAGASMWRVDGSGVTQPVSGSVTANIGTSGSLALDTTLTGGSQKAIVRGAAKGGTAAADATVSQTALDHNALDVSVQGTATVAGTVNATPPSLTKGTQGATGFSVQPLRDAGRTLGFTATAVAAVTTEAMLSLTPYRDLTAGSAATTHAVTSGKKLRLQTIVLTWRTTTAGQTAVGAVHIRFRMLAGTVVVGSPAHASLYASSAPTNAQGQGMTTTFNFPEGFELSGSMQFGLSQVAQTAMSGFDVHVLGYEY